MQLAQFMCGGTSVTEALVLTRYSQSQGLEFKFDWTLPFSEAGIVTHVAWSAWFDVPSSKSSQKANHRSILAASRMDGSIHLCLVTHASTAGAQQIQFIATHELLSPQRIGISKLAWARRKADLILGIARDGILSLSIHSSSATKPLTSKLIICRHNNFSPAASFSPVALYID
jgi:hypothetical protein